MLCDGASPASDSGSCATPATPPAHGATTPTAAALRYAQASPSVTTAADSPTLSTGADQPPLSIRPSVASIRGVPAAACDQEEGVRRDAPPPLAQPLSEVELYAMMRKQRLARDEQELCADEAPASRRTLATDRPPSAVAVERQPPGFGFGRAAARADNLDKHLQPAPADQDAPPRAVPLRPVQRPQPPPERRDQAQTELARTQLHIQSAAEERETEAKRQAAARLARDARQHMLHQQRRNLERESIQGPLEKCITDKGGVRSAADAKQNAILAQVRGLLATPQYSTHRRR